MTNKVTTITLEYNENEILILLYNLLLHYVVFHSIYSNLNYENSSFKIFIYTQALKMDTYINFT